MIMIPAFLAYGEIDYSDGTYLLLNITYKKAFHIIRYTRTKKIGEGLIWISILMTVCYCFELASLWFLSSLFQALMLLWWFRVFQRGGVPTIKQDMSCSWGYEYMELPQEGRSMGV